jgi:hypothetical protein
MNVLFSPPSLAQVKNAETLTRIFKMLAEPELCGELRVNKRLPDGDVRLILIAVRRLPVSMSLPPDWLDAEVSESEMRRISGQLLGLLPAG